MKFPVLFLLLNIFLTFFYSCTNYSQDQFKDNNIATAQIKFETGKISDENNDLKNALINYWDALTLFSDMGDSINKAEVNIHLGDLLFRFGLYEKAVIHHRESFYLLSEMSDCDKNKLADITKRLCIDYSLLNDQDTALYFLDLTNSYTGTQTLYNEIISFSSAENIFSDKRVADSIASVYEKEKIRDLESRYKFEKELYLKQKAETDKFIRLSIFAIITGILLLIIFIFYRRKKHEEALRNRQFAWFNSIVSENQRKLKEYNEDLFASHNQISELKQQISTIENLKKEEDNNLKKELEFYVSKQKELQSKEKQLRVRDEKLLSAESTRAVLIINRLKSKPVYNPVKSEEEWRLIIDFTDLLFDNFNDKITSLNILTERDRQLLCLIRLGFTTSQLAIFYGISPGSVTKAKFRLSQKLKASDCDDFASYISA